MGKAHPVNLPSISFSKKSEAIDFFKKMLSRYKDGDRLNETDSVYLHELLLRHPNPKIGEGVEYFYRERNPEQPTSGFHIKRVDGSWTDFSYLKCIKGEKDSVREYFYRACRFAVSDYLIQEKNELFDEGKGVCSITGEKLTKETSEYRHTIPSFSEILRLFEEKDTDSYNKCNSQVRIKVVE
ncbi:MAG: DCL family protein [Bacteroidota bacterium]